MAADYNQPANVEKRVRFFDGQYLQDEDFIDEQKYHIDRQRRHNRTLHVSGIADGLVVSKSAAAQLTVSAGTAIDLDGRQLVLAQAQTVDLPSSQLINKTINLYLVYREQQTDLQTQAGSQDNSRWLEQPEIKYAVKGEALQGTYPPVLLAEIPLDSSGNITSVNASVREYSGLRLPGPNADAPTLRSGANGLVRLEGGLSVTGNLGLGTSSPPTSRLEVIGDIKTHVAIINNGGYGDSYACFAYKDKGTQGNYALLQANDGQTFVNAASGKAIYFRINHADKMILDKDGNVGIGTTAPKAFQVALPESSKGGNAPGAGVTIAGGDSASIELRGTGTPYIDFAKDASTTDFHARIRLTATDKLAIEGANVGIGTTSPGAKLSFINVDDTNAGAAGITWHNPAPTMYGIHRTDGTWTWPNYQQLRLAWDTGIVLYPGTAHGKSYVDVQGGGLRVTAGNVGIGTPTAAQKLMVVGPHNAGKDPDSGMTSGGQLAIKGNAPQLDFIDTDHNDWSIHVNDNRMYFIRQPWNYTDLVLDGSGNVGIGTATPDNKLTVTATEQSAESSVTQNVANSGLNIEANYVADNYLPGIVWTTNNNNATKPKAGIWISEHATGSRLFLGTSNNYGTGITNKAVTIHESGNVGIGTTDPGSYRLNVSGGNTYLGGNLDIGNFQADNRYLTFKVAGGNQYRSGLKLWAWKENYGFKIEHDETKSGLNITRHATSALQPDPAGVTALFIATQSGNIGIGTLDPGNVKLKVQGNAHITGTLWANTLVHYWAPGGLGWVALENRAGNVTGNYSTGGPSDLRFKTALRPICNALGKVLQLHGMCYRWGETGLKYFTQHITETFSAGPDATEDENQKLWDAERQKAYQALSGDKIGLIAQELETVVPEVVHEDEEGYKYIQYQQLTALLVEAIKEQNALFQSLSGKVAVLEGR